MAANHRNLTLVREFIANLTGYTIEDDETLFAALDTSGMFAAHSNQRMAVVGDRVLHLVLASDWYPTQDSLATVANLDREVGGNTHLAAFGRRARLGPHIIVNPGQHGQPISKKTMATTVEAILGAIYLDSGEDLSAVRSAIERMDLRSPVT